MGSNPETLFADLQEGQTFSPYCFTPSADDEAIYNQCVRIPSLTRADGTAVVAEGDAERAPLSPFMLNTFKAMRAAINMPNGVLHAREQIVLQAPAFVGEALEAVLSVKSKYLKNDKRFVILELAITRVADRQPIMNIERRLTWPR
ncbi:hypothetical protein [Paraburkholderia agricolaris]|uniref:hypothetical protein n=1 Tax=Paraburkholderia agricolaris TaxID=2152888 RepID=UPI001291DBCE|nr:hypothetical protein [Paraburkholderia agricolaris]